MKSKTDAGWSSLVARRAHNPKVVGSNPAPATNTMNTLTGVFLFLRPGHGSAMPQPLTDRIPRRQSDALSTCLRQCSSFLADDARRAIAALTKRTWRAKTNSPGVTYREIRLTAGPAGKPVRPAQSPPPACHRFARPAYVSAVVRG